jgi:hypothetical protein
MTNSPPSRNQATDGTLTGLLNIFRAKMLHKLNDMLPAQVISYDRSTNRARVQLMIVEVSTDNVLLSPLQIASVPVYQAGAGGFVISFPVNSGDLGWLKANDRDISIFSASYNQSPPNTQRQHNFSDSVFIPDSFMKNVTINSEDNANLVIQTDDSTVRIALWDNKVKITAPAVILDTATTTCTGDLIVDGETTLTGSVTADSTLLVIGNITAQADLAVDGDLVVTGTSTLDGIPFNTHRHGGVQTGAGNTGTPI